MLVARGGQANALLCRLGRKKVVLKIVPGQEHGWNPDDYKFDRSRPLDEVELTDLPDLGPYLDEYTGPAGRRDRVLDVLRTEACLGKVAAAAADDVQCSAEGYTCTATVPIG